MSRDAIPSGTLCLLILKTLARDGEMHGFEIAIGFVQSCYLNDGFHVFD